MGDIEFKKLVFSACIAAILLLMAGCLAFPSSLPEKQPFQDNDLGTLRVGANKQDVIEILGNRFESFDDDRFWVYVADRAMTEWTVVELCDNCRSGPLPRKVTEYSLILQFDQNDTVRKIIRVNDRDPCNDDSTVCHSGNVLHVDGDAELNLGRNPTECRLSTYLAKPGEQPVRKWIMIDKDPVPIVLSEKYYSRWYLEAGPHMIGYRSQEQEFECRSGHSIFVQFQVDGSGDYTMKTVEQTTADSDLVNRRLALIHVTYRQENVPRNQ